MGKVSAATLRKREDAKKKRELHRERRLQAVASLLASGVRPGVKVLVKSKTQSASDGQPLEIGYIKEGYGAINDDGVRSRLYDALVRGMKARKVRLVIEIGTGASATLAKKCLDADAQWKYMGIETVKQSFNAAKGTLSSPVFGGRAEMYEGRAETCALFLAKVKKAVAAGGADVLSEIVGPIGSSEGYIVVMYLFRQALKHDVRSVPEMVATCLVPLNLHDHADVLASATSTTVCVGTQLLRANKIPYARMLAAFVAVRHCGAAALHGSRTPSLATSTGVLEVFDMQKPLGPQMRVVRLTEYECVGKGPASWFYVDALGTFIVIGGEGRGSRRGSKVEEDVRCGWPYNVPGVPTYAAAASSCASDPMCMTNWKNIVVRAPCRMRCNKSGRMFVETLSDQTAAGMPSYGVAVCVPRDGFCSPVGNGWTQGVAPWASEAFKQHAVGQDAAWLDVTELYADHDALPSASSKAAKAALLAKAWPTA